MKSISITQLREKTIGAQKAEMKVNNVNRGGYIKGNKFYFCGSVSHGVWECDVNATVAVIENEKL